MSSDSFDARPVLKSLKDFQLRTVNHAFKRLYHRQRGSRRFLVADEVGLGKTLVARGIIAKAIEHLRGTVRRIDVVYVCSNAAIAQQNVNKLNVTGQQEFSLATRLTLLPLQLKDLASRDLNFVSFTPGTTFNLTMGTGIRDERVLLCQALWTVPELAGTGPRNLLQCDVGKARWDAYVDEPPSYDEPLIAQFVKDVRSDTELFVELKELCSEFGYYRKHWKDELRWRRNKVIGKLRRKLARVCLQALEPDLVIFDEFQRFTELLDPNSAAGELAHELIGFEGVRVLMLSATPYKMLTMYGDEENHYEDFKKTLQFLLDNDNHLARLCLLLDDYRQSLYVRSERGPEIRDLLRKQLLSVMARTERVPSTDKRNAMVIAPTLETEIVAADLHRARALDQLVRAVGAQEAIEYWKSAPYLLNFMKGYKMKEQFQAHVDSNQDIAEPMEAMTPHLITKNQIKKYEAIDPDNARLRALVQHTLSNDEWKRLWLPASLPYVQRNTASPDTDTTKSLVFSTWNVVPDVIASVCSYHAERKRVAQAEFVDYFDLHKKRSALLDFSATDGRPESMSTLLILYPSPKLARIVDPLMIAYQEQRAVAIDELRAVALKRIAPVADRLSRMRREKGESRRAWYWAALARRDGRKEPGVRDWVDKRDGWRSLLDKKNQSKDQSAFTLHVGQFKHAIDGNIALGDAPADLSEVLVDLALGSPAICANRALVRVTKDLKTHSPEILQASAHIAEGFRSLFNSPDVQSMIETKEFPYWRRVLRYCAENDLQSVLDEYVHSLRESLGLIDADDAKVVREISETIRSVLSLHTSSLEMDEYTVNSGSVTRDKVRIRCRYALRFGDLKGDDEKEVDRAGVVREAFNSPFRPFTLASTSVGQEGLDFHTYCHRVWHWNLPRNPVDMEQREGRVNRYKGHAVRKNVAKAIGLQGLAKEWRRGKDPWHEMFEIAKRRRRDSGSGKNDLTPYWIYEDVDNPCCVERMVPLPPLSSEKAKYKALIRSLAIYRLAFGQPRQEDLLEYLSGISDEKDEKALRDMQLDLSP